jgi:hypothetical protein
VTDIPVPAKSRKDALISSRTLKGRAAGPGLKLKILSLFIEMLSTGKILYDKYENMLKTNSFG